MVPAKELVRRKFLQIGGGSLLAAAAGRVFGQATLSPQLGRKPPANAVTLKSPSLEVVLDGTDGLPYEFRVLAQSTRFRGEQSGEPMTATICNKAQWKFQPVPLRVEFVKTSAAQADFQFIAKLDGNAAASFTIRYLLQDATVTVTMHDVQEHTGFELIEVAIPSLVTVGEEDGAAWLAHGDTGGSLAMLNQAKAASLSPNRFWGKTLATLPVVMIGNGKAVCVQEVTTFMDGTELRVFSVEGRRRASLGTIKTHRVDGSRCFDMNTGNDATTKNCGNRNTPNLLIKQESSCRLDFIAVVKGDGTADWLEAAQFVRKRMPAIPKHIYDDAFTYGVLCDQPLFEKPTATFEECERIIRDVSALTDNARQIVHLWGWQYKGKDTGYPAVDQVNSRIGGFEGMLRLMQRAKEFNCTVTLSDNYDDAYRSSPSWNPEWIARRPDGELWESRNWTGENSYILGMAKYAKAAGLERVRYTCERYKLPETTHVDVLSYYSIRNDWDPTHPASGIKNLEARCRIVEEFAKYGVDVSSEALRYAFLGKISSFWYMTGPGVCPFGGKPIPLLPTIYRKSAVWGQAGRTTSLADAILKMLFYNGYAHASFRGAADLKAATDRYYLMMLPWFKLHSRNIEGFRREGERTSIALEGNSGVEIDWAKQTYSATVDGAEITRDSSVYCPLDEERIAFYSASQRELSAPLPRNWKADNLVAFALSTDDRQEVRVAVKNGIITVPVNMQEPLIVYRDRSKVPRQPS